MRWLAISVVFASFALGQGTVVFLSTQLRPLEEAQKMRQVILRDFPGRVEFIPEDTGPFTDRVLAEARAGRVTISLLGGLHGDFPPFWWLGPWIPWTISCPAWPSAAFPRPF